MQAPHAVWHWYPGCWRHSTCSTSVMPHLRWAQQSVDFLGAQRCRLQLSDSCTPSSLVHFQRMRLSHGWGHCATQGITASYNYTAATRYPNSCCNISAATLLQYLDTFHCNMDVLFIYLTLQRNLTDSTRLYRKVIRQVVEISCSASWALLFSVSVLRFLSRGE